jgi:hypothetical protein
VDKEKLDELTRWATAQEQSLMAHEIADIAANFRDLARCANAWAKVERILNEHPGSSITLVLGNKSMICLNVHNGTTGETAMGCIEAIAAVEAAPEVTP